MMGQPLFAPGDIVVTIADFIYPARDCGELGVWYVSGSDKKKLCFFIIEAAEQLSTRGSGRYMSDKGLIYLSERDIECVRVLRRKHEKS